MAIDTTGTSGGRATVVTGVVAVCVALGLGGCAVTEKLAGIEPIERVVGPHDPVPPGGGRYQVGKPYSIAGRTYVPREDPNYDSSGIASWYGGDFHHGTRTANGEVYDRTTLSAAHPTMPLPSYARVTNLKNGRSIVVRVNDRGPYAAGRLIDISEKTAEMLDMKRFGVGRVRVQYVGRAGLAGSDQRVLAATLRGPGLMSTHDERILMASADLPPGPRRTGPNFVPTAPVVTPTLVADAGTDIVPLPTPSPASASLFAKAKTPPLPAPVRAYVQIDASSYDLAGVDAKILRAALAQPRPAASSAEVIAAELPTASGAPMMIMPVPGEAALTPPTTLPVRTSFTTSYAAERRIAEAHAVFAAFGEGSGFTRLAD